MGYMHYETPMGEAGYGVTDVCHEPGCTAIIDRGLAYLCGAQPGVQDDECGCGEWFCGEHLFMAPRHLEIIGGGLCGRCIEHHPDLDDED